MPGIQSRPKSAPPIVYYTLFPSPVGRIGIAATSGGICRVTFNVRGDSDFRNLLRREYGCRPVRRDRHFKSIASRLESYFSGQPVRFSAKIDLNEGTPFQQKVWGFLRSIPYGQTRSYRSVARGIGHPNSFRAVGGACGNNPIGILIPCHRVINATGGLGGFTGGLRVKRRLLRLEKLNR
jgi:methylated-DNA-[protein]-cysteine S-methyltransferase